MRRKESSGEGRWGWLHHGVDVLNTTELDTKIVPVVSFMFCVFYPNGKVKKIRGIPEESWVIWETGTGERAQAGSTVLARSLSLPLSHLPWSTGTRMGGRQVAPLGGASLDLVSAPREPPSEPAREQAPPPSGNLG